jgi:UPF0716 protein FxsA
MPIFRFLLILFIAIPLMEIYFLIQVGDVIGALPTIVLVVGTAVLGVALLRIQGISTVARMQMSLQRGELPAQTILEGVMLLLAGGLLLTPGFVTDFLGFLLLVPYLRQKLAETLIFKGILRAQHNSEFSSANTQHKTLDGEYEHLDE